MRIRADHAFHIGSQHLRSGLPCQDYALSGSCGYGNMTFAIVSDGCSSGRHTDVGARVIGHSTALAIQAAQSLESHTIDLRALMRDTSAQSALNLRTDDMLATVAYVARCADAAYMVARVIGDGVIASLDNNGFTTMTRYEWANNTPFYRTYLDDAYEGFIKAHGGDRSAKVASSETWFIEAYGNEQGSVAYAQHSLDEGMAGFSESFRSDAFRTIAVFTDGVTQVEGMHWRDVVLELLAFKSTEGDFVKRRMNRFLRDCAKNGTAPVDDISMAAVSFDREAADVA